MSHELDTDRSHQSEDVEEMMKAIGAKAWKIGKGYTLIMTSGAEKQLLKNADSNKVALPERFIATDIQANKGKIETSNDERFMRWQNWLIGKGFKQGTN